VTIPCPQCGGQVALLEAAGFPACPYCGAGLVLDLGGVRPHYLYLPRVEAGHLLSLLRRWAARGRRPTPRLVGPPCLVYHPFWRYAGEGRPRLVPAWPTLEPGWAELSPPDAEQCFFASDRVAGAEVVEPTVPEEAARRQVAGWPDGRPGELVHLPCFRLSVRLGGEPLSLWMEACTGALLGGPATAPAEGLRGAASARPLLLGGVLMLALAAVVPGVAALPLLAATGFLLFRRLLISGRGAVR